MSVWIVEIFRMSVDSLCNLLVYMTILWIVVLLMNYERSIIEFFCIMNGLFGHSSDMVSLVVLQCFFYTW